ncbi:unnamed protein product [Sphenostylis stenocarpa]|uniref:Uncharacterized protein n=1 Tax=Sphenostylis stenocarpa TaxID=92480 RepID=A0AA86VX82_9FABA|nr:unnamed protein product [Sphenostylis stenocarpa]
MIGGSDSAKIYGARENLRKVKFDKNLKSENTTTTYEKEEVNVEFTHHFSSASQQPAIAFGSLTLSEVRHVKLYTQNLADKLPEKLAD